jgi:hypothetical protein
MAKTAMGIRIVYMPVIMGIPAILAYPMTSGMNMAAMTMPAMISGRKRERSKGNTPPNNALFNLEVMLFIKIAP